MNKVDYTESLADIKTSEDFYKKLKAVHWDGYVSSAIQSYFWTMFQVKELGELAETLGSECVNMHTTFVKWNDDKIKLGNRTPKPKLESFL